MEVSAEATSPIWPHLVLRGCAELLVQRLCAQKPSFNSAGLVSLNPAGVFSSRAQMQSWDAALIAFSTEILSRHFLYKDTVLYYVIFEVNFLTVIKTYL